MLSKILQMLAFPKRKVLTGVMKSSPPKRRMAHGFARNQYNIPMTPNYSDLGYVLTTHWEVIPVFFVTAFAYAICGYTIWYGCFNKTDVKFSRNDKFIFETMDLCHPTCHKMMTVTQEYKPWPELAALLADMEDIEKRNYRIMKGEEA